MQGRWYYEDCINKSLRRNTITTRFLNVCTHSDTRCTSQYKRWYLLNDDKTVFKIHRRQQSRTNVQNACAISRLYHHLQPPIWLHHHHRRHYVATLFTPLPITLYNCCYNWCTGLFLLWCTTILLLLNIGLCFLMLCNNSNSFISNHSWQFATT